MIRSAEEIRRDRINEAKRKDLEIELSISGESFEKELTYISSEGNFIIDQLYRAINLKNEIINSKISNESASYYVMKYNAYIDSVKANMEDNSDSDVVNFLNNNKVSMENYQFGSFSKLFLAREGIMNWIKTLIHKLKQWISFAYNKVKTYLTKISRGFDNIEEKSKDLISKFSSSSLPNTFSDYQSEVFVTWLENSFPLMLYLSSDIGYDKQEIRSVDKLLSFLKKRNDSLLYPRLADMEVRNISDYNNNFKNFYENRSIQDSNGAWTRDSVIDSVIKKSSFKLKGNELVKPYTSDGKNIYCIDMGAEGDGKVLKTYFVKVPFSSLGIEKPDKTKGTLILNNNIPLGCVKLLSFVKDNINGVMKSITDIPNKLYKEKEALFRELETFEDNDKSEASKCIASYVKFMNQLYTNYLFGEVYASYDAMHKTYEMCNKAYLLITSKEQ